MRKIVLVSLCTLLLLTACSQVRETADQILTPPPMEEEGDIPPEIATAAAATLMAMATEDPQVSSEAESQATAVPEEVEVEDTGEKTIDEPAEDAEVTSNESDSDETTDGEADLSANEENVTESESDSVMDSPAPVSVFYPNATYQLGESLEVGAYLFRHWVSESGEPYQGLLSIDGPGMDNIWFENVTAISVVESPDLNNNGIPEVTVEQYTGGASCCFGNTVYEVRDEGLTKLLKLRPNKTGAQFEDLNGDGVAEALTTDDIFSHRYCGGAGSPYPLVVMQYDAEADAYLPASPDFPDAYLDSIAYGKSQAETIEPGDMGELDGTNKCAVLYYALPLLYSGQTDLAWQAFEEHYQGDDADAFRWEIEDALQASDLYTGIYQAVNPDYEIGSAIDPSVEYELAESLDYGRFVFEYFTYPDGDLPGGDYVRIMADGERFAIVDYAIGFGDLNGTDLTNDGTPEVIIERFTGGAHCCSGTEVYSVGDRLENVLSRVPAECGGGFNDLDGDGTYEYITCDDVFAYAYCPYVGSPFPQVVMKYDVDRGYIPASPEFPQVYDESIVRNLESAQVSEPGAYGEFDGSNKCSVLPVVLDYLYSGQDELAWQTFNDIYKGDDIASFPGDILRTVSNSRMYVAPPQDAVLPGEASDVTYAVVGVAADDVLNMRSGPGVENDIVGTIGPDGQVIRILPAEIDPTQPDWVKAVYGVNEGWVNATFLAEQKGFIDRVIDVKADTVMQALRDRDMTPVALETHPEKGLLISADGFIDETDPQFIADFVAGLMADTTVYSWGFGFGDGEEIRYTFADYLSEIAYTEDLAQPDLIGFRERVSSGNTIDNSQQVFPDGVVIEYYYAGTEEYGYLDWRSIRLVFEPFENDWKLVAIVADAWAP